MKYKINILQMAHHADNENTRKVKTGTQMIMIIETILSFHRLLPSSVFNNMNVTFSYNFGLEIWFDSDSKDCKKTQTVKKKNTFHKTFGI